MSSSRKALLACALLALAAARSARAARARTDPRAGRALSAAADDFYPVGERAGGDDDYDYELCSRPADERPLANDATVCADEEGYFKDPSADGADYEEEAGAADYAGDYEEGDAEGDADVAAALDGCKSEPPRRRGTLSDLLPLPSHPLPLPFRVLQRQHETDRPAVHARRRGVQMDGPGLRRGGARRRPRARAAGAGRRPRASPRCPARPRPQIVGATSCPEKCGDLFVKGWQFSNVDEKCSAALASVIGAKAEEFAKYCTSEAPAAAAAPALQPAPPAVAAAATVANGTAVAAVVANVTAAAAAAATSAGTAARTLAAAAVAALLL